MANNDRKIQRLFTIQNLMFAFACEPTKPLDEHVHDSYVAKKIVPNATSIRHEAVWPAVTPPSDTAIEDILLSRNLKITGPKWRCRGV